MKMNSNDFNFLTCTVNIEWKNAQGIVQRKILHKSAGLKLIRNEHRQMFVEVTTNKSAPIRLELKSINVHKKFMSEGKSSIEFKDDRCIIYLSNAPPSQLLGFLKTMFVKMTGSKPQQGVSTSLRTQLLSNKPKQYDEISPVTISDLENVRQKLSRATDTTPSPLSKKRKLQQDTGENQPKLKRMYSSSPILNEPLNIKQKAVLEACLAGINVFFTGSAGTGKSYLLKQIVAALPPDVTTATASTGVAACHIGGITLHQFAGIGNGDATIERAFQIASKPAAAAIWRKCRHLIIDEISMIDGDYFEKIETIARMVRKTDKPFGGIQLILCGDFFQLPPVRKDNTKKFCFQTPAWKKCVQRCFELTQIHRQNDSNFIDILNKIRIGKITDEITQKLASTMSQKIERNGILATRLCSHTNDADIINESKLKELSGQSRIFEAQDSDPYSTKQLDQQTPVAGKIILKIGAQVMLLRNINISTGLVNGARGVIKEFRDDLPVVRMMNKHEFIPLGQKLKNKLETKAKSRPINKKLFMDKPLVTIG
ncbi:dna helicase-related [Holotrichia oblita]|uniref:Dna helicase-related n=2 Tax=Holotrichia oblita TaxID=644536 RepID=A0ACB9SN21_HOLOL|nr:dna helicase-related [Holotrichia oblita]KAI4456023.1 dna helicase-related [Holotrichia oblita]